MMKQKGKHGVLAVDHCVLEESLHQARARGRAERRLPVLVQADDCTFLVIPKGVYR